MHRTLQKCHCEPVTDVTGVAIRNTLTLHTCHTGETDSHVAALLGMTFFMEIILPCVGTGQSAAPTHTL